MAKQLNSYEVKLDFKADTSQAKKEIQSLQDQLSNAIRIGGSQSNFGGAITKDLGKALSTAAQLKDQLQQAVNVDTGRLDLGKFYDSMKKAGLSLDDYQRDLMKLGPEGEKSFDQLANSIANAELPLKRSNALLTEFWTTLKNTARWQISSSLLHGFMGAMSSAYGYAQDLNESLNNIRIVTGYNVDKMSDFAAAANKAAQALSTTTTSYTDAALIYYQQGLSDEEVLGRTDVTIKLANVARESAETVSDQMTAVWNNFYDGSKSLEYYADVMTALGAATASSTSEISQGLEKFAAVADTVGLSYEYATAALATVTATTRQSADIVGTAFKTLFARLEQLKLGETLDDGTTLGQYSQALEKVGVLIKDDAGNLKDMDDILDELAAKWQTLAKDQQVALAQQVAGVRQYTQLIALMDNWDFMESNLEVARGAEGTLEEQADIYAESWEAAQKRVKAAAEDIYGALLNDEFFIDLNNVLADALKSLKSLIEGMGGLKGVLFSLGAIITTVFQKQLSGSLNNALYSMKMMTAAGQKEYRDFQVESMQRTLVATQGEGATKNSYNEAVAKAYVEHANLYNRFREISAHLSEDQIKILKPLLEENEALRENVKLRAEAAQKANQQANAQKNSFFNQNQKAIKDLGIENELNDILEKAKSTGIGEGSESPLAKFYNQSWSKKNYSTAELKGRYQDLYNSLFPGDSNDMLNAFGIDPSRIKEYKTKIQNGIKGNFQGNGMQQFVDEIYEATVDTSTRPYLQDINNLFDEAGKKAGFSSAKIKQLKEAFQEVAKTSSEAATKTQEMSNATEDLNNSTENTDHALHESFNANLQLSDSIVATVGAVTSLASAINMVQGLGSLWKNEDVSIGQKIVTTITTLGMAFSLLSKNISYETAVHLANVAAHIAGAGSVELETAAELKKIGILKILNTEVGKHLLMLGAWAAAIGALIFIIYQLIQAHQAEVNKIKDAQAATNELKNNYENLNSSAEEFKQTISDYQDGIKALDELKDNQEEYNKALEESNEKARNLIETYGLFGTGQSYVEDGIIKISDSALQEIQNQKDSQVRQARTAYLQSALYTNELQARADKQQVYSNLPLATDEDNKKLLDAFSEWRNTSYSEDTNDISSLKEFIDLNKENYDGLSTAIETFVGEIDVNLINALEENSNLLQKSIDAENYYLKELINNKLQGDQSLRELATVNGELDTKLYNAILAAYTEVNINDVSDKINSEDLGEITQISSLGGLGNFLLNQGINLDDLREFSGNDNLGKYYEGPNGQRLSLSKDEVRQLYGQFVLGDSEAQVKSDNGFNNFYDRSGKELQSNISDAVMYQEVAKQLVASIVYEINNIDSSSLNGFIENAKSVGSEYGIDFATTLTEELTNNDGNINLTGIFTQLSQAAYDGIDINQLLNKLFENVDDEQILALKDKILEAWNNYDSIDNTESQNAIGEETAEKVGLNVEAFKLYREELRNTYPELAKNAKAANDVAIANMRLAKGVNSILDNWEEYNEILSDSNAQFEDVANVTADMKEALEDMLNIDASTFELLPPDFAQKNWKLITDAVNGVEGKVDELRDKAGEEILLNVAADDTDLQNKLLELHNFLSEYNNNPNFEINVPIAMEGNEEFYAKCQEIINAAGFTAEQAQKYFASMGYDVEFHEATTPEVTRTHRQYGRWFDPETREWMDINGSIKEYEPAVKGTAIKTITPNGNYGGNVAVKRTGGGGGGSKGGGGGGKSSSPAESQKVTSKADAGIKRYKEIDDAIQDLTKDQERLNKVTDAYYGANKISYMKQQLQLLGKEVELHKERFKWAQEYYNEDKADLDNFAKTTLGVEIEYDEDGSIKNYTSIMDQLYSRLNEKESYWANAANFSSKEAQDEYKKANVDPIADTMKEFQKYVDTFDESNEERKKEMDEVIALQIEYKEHEYEIWQEGWKMQQEIIEDQAKFLDHAKKMLGDSAVEMGEILALTYGNDNNYIQNTTDQLELYKAKEQELHQLLEENKITQADYVDGMIEIRDQYLSLTENLKELDDFMMEYYGKTLQKVSKEVDEYTDRMGKLNDQLERYQKVMKLTGRELDYAGMGKILEAQQSIYQDQYKVDAAQLESLRKREQEVLDRLKAAGNDPAAKEMFERQLKETRDEIVEYENKVLDDLTNVMEKAQDIIENSRAEAMAKYEEMMTDGLGFDYIDGLLERQSTLQEEYLTKTNQVFETTKMLRKLQSDMDATNNRAAKQRLSNFSKEIEDLKNRESMTKADLELAQKRYDLLLAEIALEEAQKAKTTVRLQRDNEGNYGYVYTADEGDIAKAQDDLFNAENDLYNTRLRITNEYGEKLIQLEQEQADALNELWDAYYNKHSISEDEYYQKRDEIRKHYADLRATYAHNYTVAQQNDARVVADAWINQDQKMIASSTDWEKNTNRLIAQTEEAFMRYEGTSDYVRGRQEYHLGTIREETEKVTTASDELKDEIKDKLKGEYEDLWKKVDAVYLKYKDERREVLQNIIAYGNYATALQTVIDKYRALAEAQNIKTFNSDGDKKDTLVGVKEIPSTPSATTGNGGGLNKTTSTDDPPSNPTSTYLDSKTVQDTITQAMKNYSDSDYNKSGCSAWVIGQGPYTSKSQINSKVAEWMKNHKKQSIVATAAEAVKKVNGSASQDVGGNNFSRKTAAKMSRASGGYTGEWSDGSGKLAILHSNEIVLNSHDTDNMFGIIDMVREITKTIDVNAAGVIGGYGALSSGSMNAGPQTLEQNVQITASFPNATDHNEIEEAFNNLINKASQYANRTR